MTDRRTLSEDESKKLLAPLGARFPRETVVEDSDAAVRAAEAIGFPVVAKLIGERLAHKSERGLVRLGLGDAAAVRQACELLLAQRRNEDGDVRLLIAEQIAGSRELIVGMVRDPQFGATLLIG
ncbi:MAG: acetate--CoA ligase family protein, partial [Ilumatobacteraceae bacterium]